MKGALNFSRAVIISERVSVCRYVGYALTTKWEGSRERMQIIGFDMGGTSTDVSRYAGSYEHVFESTTAGAACCHLGSPILHACMADPRPIYVAQPGVISFNIFNRHCAHSAPQKAAPQNGCMRKEVIVVS